MLTTYYSYYPEQGFQWLLFRYGQQIFNVRVCKTQEDPLGYPFYNDGFADYVLSRSLLQ